MLTPSPHPHPPKKVQKFKISNFTILLTTLVETLPRSVHEFLWSKSAVLWEEMLFETFAPIWSHVNDKNGKNWNFVILWPTTLVDTLPRSMHAFLEVNLMCTSRGEVVSIFSPIWSYINAKEKKIVKGERFKILRKQKWSGDMVVGTIPPNSVFTNLIHSVVSEKTMSTDGRTPDARVTTVALPCSSTKQS